MMKNIFRYSFFFVILVFNVSAYSQNDWNEPIAPFRIAGNIYYVGARDITSYLITTPKGHILLDSGMPETVPQIKANVAKLGFKLEDVKIILNSHAHFDHGGGIAELKRLTKATFYASEGDAPLFERGGKNDPNFGDRYLFEAVKPDKLLKDGQKVKLGGTTIQAHLTPGHSPGCTTWTMTVKENGRSLRVIFVGSASVTSEHVLVSNAKYPNIETDYLKTFAWLNTQTPDLFLASHGNFYELAEKAEKFAEKPDVNPFIDPQGYKAYVERSEKAFHEKLAAQKAARK